MLPAGVPGDEHRSMVPFLRWHRSYLVRGGALIIAAAAVTVGWGMRFLADLGGLWVFRVLQYLLFIVPLSMLMVGTALIVAGVNSVALRAALTREGLELTRRHRTGMIPWHAVHLEVRRRAGSIRAETLISAQLRTGAKLWDPDRLLRSGGGPVLLGCLSRSIDDAAHYLQTALAAVGAETTAGARTVVVTTTPQRGNSHPNTDGAVARAVDVERGVTDESGR